VSFNLSVLYSIQSSAYKRYDMLLVLCLIERVMSYTESFHVM